MKKFSLNLFLFGEEGDGAAVGSAENCTESEALSEKEDNQTEDKTKPVETSDSSAAPVGGKEEKSVQFSEDDKSVEPDELSESITANTAAPQESILPPGVMRIMQSLAEVYHLQETDIDGIAGAFNRTQARNALEERLHRRSAAKQYQALLKEAETLSKKIKGFDLETELDDDRFSRMIHCGFSMEEAWQAVHMNQLLCAAVRRASENGAREAVEQYRRGAQRPDENGVKGQAGIARKTSVEHLTGRGIRDILRRVEKGAKVKF